MKPLLQVSSLYAGYGDIDVVKGVSLTVNEGQTVALIGPNGHGKTTLLKALSGLVDRVRGEAVLGGLQLVGAAAEDIVAAGLVHIPQGDMVFVGMTVEENLLMGAHPPAAYRQRQASLDFVYGTLPRLAERRTQYANTLSGGERRMLAIGRGLMSRGCILLIDEPSLGLAPMVIEDVYAVIRRLSTEGQTILLVEESAGRVVDVAGCVHLIDDGHIVWTGTGRDVADSTSLLATYLGS